MFPREKALMVLDAAALLRYLYAVIPQSPNPATPLPGVVGPYPTDGRNTEGSQIVNAFRVPARKYTPFVVVSGSVPVGWMKSCSPQQV